MTSASSLFFFRRVFPTLLLLSVVFFPIRSLKAATPSTDPGNGGIVIPTNAYLLNPSSLTFTDIPVGQVSPVQSMTFTNNSSSKLTGIMVAMDAVSPEFAETNTCSELAVGESCQIDVTFTASAEGNKTTSLILSFQHTVPTGAIMISLGGMMNTTVTEAYLASLSGNGLPVVPTPDPGSTSGGNPADGSGSTPPTNGNGSGTSNPDSGSGCALTFNNAQHSLTIIALLSSCFGFLILLRKSIRSKTTN